MATGMLSNNYSWQQIFLKNNLFKDYSYTNSTGSTVTITIGTLMGTILATGKTAPQASGSTDGSEMPRGIAGQTFTVTNGATVTIPVCYAGDVNQNALILNGSDTLSTAVRTVSTGGGTIGDLITQNTTINLYPSIELSGYDN